MIAKKLFYVPGLVSLIGLPIHLLIVHPEDKKAETVVKINLPSYDTINTNKFSKANVGSFLKTKQIEQIVLDDDNEYADRNDYLLNRKKAFIINEIER